MAKISKAKKERLEKAGWRVGSTKEFLGLTAEDEEWIETYRVLANLLTERRKAKKWTQDRLAREVKSSQSRVAKMEAGDQSVSLNLLIRSLYKIGVTREEVGKAIAS